MGSILASSTIIAHYDVTAIEGHRRPWKGGEPPVSRGREGAGEPRVRLPRTYLVFQLLVALVDHRRRCGVLPAPERVFVVPVRVVSHGVAIDGCGAPAALTAHVPTSSQVKSSALVAPGALDRCRMYLHSTRGARSNRTTRLAGGPRYPPPSSPATSPAWGPVRGSAGVMGRVPWGGWV